MWADLGPGDFGFRVRVLGCRMDLAVVPNTEAEREAVRQNLVSGVAFGFRVLRFGFRVLGVRWGVGIRGG